MKNSVSTINLCLILVKLLHQLTHTLLHHNADHHVQQSHREPPAQVHCGVFSYFHPTFNSGRQACLEYISSNGFTCDWVVRMLNRLYNGEVGAILLWVSPHFHKVLSYWHHCQLWCRIHQGWNSIFCIWQNLEVFNTWLIFEGVWISNQRIKCFLGYSLHEQLGPDHVITVLAWSRPDVSLIAFFLNIMHFKLLGPSILWIIDILLFHLPKDIWIDVLMLLINSLVFFRSTVSGFKCQNWFLEALEIYKVEEGVHNILVLIIVVLEIASEMLVESLCVLFSILLLKCDIDVLFENIDILLMNCGVLQFVFVLTYFKRVCILLHELGLSSYKVAIGCQLANVVEYFLEWSAFHL